MIKPGIFDDEIKIRLQHDSFTRRIPCAIIKTNYKDNGTKESESLAIDVVWEKIDPYKPIYPNRSLDLSDDAAQILMDDLWNCGIRPTEGAGTAGSMAAVQRHLEDMRRLVFKEKYKEGK